MLGLNLCVLHDHGFPLQCLSQGAQAEISPGTRTEQEMGCLVCLLEQLQATCLWFGSEQDRVSRPLFSLVQYFISSHRYWEDFNEYL